MTVTCYSSPFPYYQGSPKSSFSSTSPKLSPTSLSSTNLHSQRSSQLVFPPLKAGEILILITLDRLQATLESLPSSPSHATSSSVTAPSFLSYLSSQLHHLCVHHHFPWTSTYLDDLSFFRTQFFKVRSLLFTPKGPRNPSSVGLDFMPLPKRVNEPSSPLVFDPTRYLKEDMDEEEIEEMGEEEGKRNEDA
ncbi:hypothetical protein HMI54_009222 [Coelomomyces lativittatus]|nr:hypothetical protein HMI54_009222 [Coelomomyces lativittatus]KAJ1508340.1 hypothetical protein HMI56_007334 [Coelomomyces lativittatus]KAJ1517068.1 hypothetical protein HMI55_000711 [Coelomomyces lativittatus]